MSDPLIRYRPDPHSAEIEAPLSTVIDAAVGGVSGQVLYRGPAVWGVTSLAALGGGSVTAVSVATANGFGGTVATATTTPVITIRTGVTGILLGDGTGVSAVTVSTGLDLTNGVLTATGTGLTAIASHYVVANTTSGSAVPAGVTLSALIDAAFTAGQGDILKRGATDWGRLAPDTAGRFLKTQGAGADPIWADLPAASSSVSGVVSLPVTVAQGGTGLATLTSHGVLLGEGTATVGAATIGTAGRVLIDQGASADPAFTVISGTGTLASDGTLTTTGPHLFTAVLGLGTAITTGTNVTSNYLVCPFAGTFTRWDMVVPTATQPSGASLVVDVMKSAAGAGSFTTLWSTTANRPTITSGNNNAGGTAFNVTTFSAGDVLRFDVITAGGGAVQNVTLVISSRMNQ